MSEEEDLEGYLTFFFEAVRSAAKDATARANGLVALRERYYHEARLDRSRVTALVPLLFTTPYVSTKRVQRLLEVTPQGARNLLLRAETYGWVESIGQFGQGGMHLWLSKQVLDVIEQPIAY